MFGNTSAVLLFAVPFIGALRGCVVPCLRSMLSKVIPSDKLGKVCAQYYVDFCCGVVSLKLIVVVSLNSGGVPK